MPEASRAEKAALRTDGRTLCAAWMVTMGVGFTNHGDDFTQFFLSGDAVDLHVCTDATAPGKRKEFHPADGRLFFSRLGGKPVAVLYRAKARCAAFESGRAPSA